MNQLINLSMKQSHNPIVKGYPTNQSSGLKIQSFKQTFSEVESHQPISQPPFLIFPAGLPFPAFPIGFLSAVPSPGLVRLPAGGSSSPPTNMCVH